MVLGLSEAFYPHRLGQVSAQKVCQARIAGLILARLLHNTHTHLKYSIYIVGPKHCPFSNTFFPFLFFLFSYYMPFHYYCRQLLSAVGMELIRIQVTSKREFNCPARVKWMFSSRKHNGSYCYS